jgi:hypothetical protein
MFSPWNRDPCKKCIITMVCTEECPDKHIYWTTVLKITDSLPVYILGGFFFCYFLSILYTFLFA